MRCAPCSHKSTWNKKQGNGKKERETTVERKELLSEPSVVILWKMSDTEFYREISETLCIKSTGIHFEYVHLPSHTHELPHLLCNIWGTHYICLDWHWLKAAIYPPFKKLSACALLQTATVQICNQLHIFLYLPASWRRIPIWQVIQL